MTIIDKFRLDGKIALVTGAAQGLGQAYACALADAGADIALLDMKSCDKTGEMINQLGKQFIKLECDLSSASPSELDDIVDQVVDKFKRIDILVNNAGTIFRSPALEHPEDKWDMVYNVNIKSLFFLSQAAAKKMKAQGSGKIINVCSMLSFQGGILVASYASTKHAVMGLTRNMGNELAQFGINVNAIAPGYILTENTQPLHDDPKRNPAILERLPIGRWGDPEDLMGSIVYLASPASDYLSGTILNVDGGWLSR